MCCDLINIAAQVPSVQVIPSSIARVHYVMFTRDASLRFGAVLCGSMTSHVRS